MCVIQVKQMAVFCQFLETHSFESLFKFLYIRYIVKHVDLSD